MGQILVTYRPNVEQVLVLFPPFLANLLSEAGDHNPTGVGQGDFAVNEGDPPSCTVGFLPPQPMAVPGRHQHRRHAEKPVLQTAPRFAAGGARRPQLPCMGKPGKRAPTVEICDSDKPFEPLAMREHLLGPYRWIPA